MLQVHRHDKNCLALPNKIIPPTANVEEINPKLRIEDSHFIDF